MKDIIAIINQKGGVGKTTTANALGAGLYLKGYKVLYVDMEAQGNLSYSMKALNRPLTTLEVLTGQATAEEAITQTAQGDIIASSENLAGADTLIKGKDKEYQLKRALEPIKKKYDYIIIDTPPALGVLTVNALTACKSVVITTQADIFSLQGIGQLTKTIEAVKQYCNSSIKVKGILTTRYTARTNLSKDMITLLDDTARQLHTRLYETKIRECTALKEAQATQTDIFTYSPRSNGSKDYRAFIEEYLTT